MFCICLEILFALFHPAIWKNASAILQFGTSAEICKSLITPEEPCDLPTKKILKNTTTWTI